MFEWSVEACLHASSKHDAQIIEEAQSIDEQTLLGMSQLNLSQMNKTIGGPSDPIDLEEEPNSFLREFNGYASQILEGTDPK